MKFLKKITFLSIFLLSQFEFFLFKVQVARASEVQQQIEYQIRMVQEDQDAPKSEFFYVLLAVGISLLLIKFIVGSSMQQKDKDTMCSFLLQNVDKIEAQDVKKVLANC